VARYLEESGLPGMAIALCRGSALACIIPQKQAVSKFTSRASLVEH